MYVNAASVFNGVLTNDGVKKVDDQTVEFNLEAPNGNFPYLISSDNYNMIVVPNGTDYSKWDKTFIGTGPFTMNSYQPKIGATFLPNPNWWGGKVLPPSSSTSSTRPSSPRSRRFRAAMSTSST